MNRWRVEEDIGSKETDGCPLTEPDILHGHIEETCMVRESRDEVSVEIDEADKRLHLLFV
jgi:hypothetical protein